MGGPIFEAPPKNRIPWHLWGSTAVLTARAGAAAPAQSAVVQLARVAYRRPESWRFFLYAKWLSSSGLMTGVRANFGFAFGVGRSMVNFPNEYLVNGDGLLTFRFNGPLVGQPIKYTTKARSPLVDDSVAGSYTETEILVAENIQLSADVSLIAPGPAAEATLEVGAFVAPNVHIRPDWFKRVFDGGELEGS